MKRKKAQSSMILIIVVLMMFIGIAVFLLQLASTVSKEEYTTFYAGSLLLSMMRTETGFTDSRCRTVSDMVACACFTPDWVCGSESCSELANRTVTGYMGVFMNQTTSLKYLYTTTSDVICRDDEGNPRTLELGDPSLKTSKKEAFKVVSYPLSITKTFEYSTFIMRMQLMLAKK
jgi:hypothetical protein